MFGPPGEIWVGDRVEGLGFCGPGVLPRLRAGPCLYDGTGGYGMWGGVWSRVCRRGTALSGCSFVRFSVDHSNYADAGRDSAYEAKD